MAFWCYMLRCADGTYYTGHTDNLDRRFGEHQFGGFCDFTSRRRPVELVWEQEFSTRLEALEAERRIKPWSRAKKEGLIKGDWAQVSFYARPPGERPSTALGSNGEWETRTGLSETKRNTKRNPFVPSAVEGPPPSLQTEGEF